MFYLCRELILHRTSGFQWRVFWRGFSQTKWSNLNISSLPAGQGLGFNTGLMAALDASYSWMGCYVVKVFIKSGVNEVKRLLQTFCSVSFPISRCGGLSPLLSRSCKRDVIICRQTQPRQTALKAFCLSLSLPRFSPLPWVFLHGGVSITAALRARRNHLGSLSNRYSRLGGVARSWHRCTGHKDETAALSCLKIVRIISSTHVSIEAAVAVETRPPPSSSSSNETGNFSIKLSSTKHKPRQSRADLYHVAGGWGGVNKGGI